MNKKITRMFAAFLSVLMIISCLSGLSLPVAAADYRNGAQSGPSASYAGSRYFRNYQRVPITGDNRTDLIAIALSQLGYQEGAANGYFSGEVSGGSNYVEMSYNMGDLGLGYGGSDYPWCASFVSWCLYQSRCTNHATYSSLCRNHSGDYNYIWKEISCAMWVNQLKGAGYFSYSAGMGGSYTPKYGDLVFFKSSSSPSHIGICLYVSNGVLYTVEGNTSDASGLETNGGGVYFKSYSLSSSYLYGYGRLPYNSNSSVKKIDYSGATPSPGLYIANAAKYIYSSEYATSAFTTIPRFSMFEITKVGANNRLFGSFTDVNGSTVTGWVENNSSRILQLSASNVMSGSWEFDGTGYKYKWSDGSYASQGWLQDPESMAWYYIGANGYAQSGWLYLSTGTFYLDTNSNAMLTGHRYIDGRWYYFNNDGYLCDGTWEYDGVGYRYRYVDGTYGANCWLDDANNNYVRYYLDANGYSVRGWQKIGDVWYYFDPNSGAMLSGWLYIDNKWYYTDSSGAMQTGWVEEDGHYFYFDSSGARVENTTMDINGSTCTFDTNGVLVEGSVIEDTQTPNVGGGYSSYQGGMPADGTGVVQAHGIDISKWNNGDDWTTLKLNLAAVKAAGIDFVIMRCGSTNKGEDPMFDMYYNECKRLGLDVGVYFYTYALDAATALSDAKKCVSYIEGKQLEYPVYLDFEDPTHETIGGTLSATICKTFMDEVASHNYLTGLYSYKSWLELDWVTDSGLRSKYEAWAAYPVKSMDHSKYDAEMSQKFGMYQYTFEYVIANAGTFDANVCYKDYPTIVKTYGFNNYAASSTPNLSSSWVQDDIGLRYQYADGTFAPPGWLWDSANSAWYYLDQNGYAVSGWVEDGGKTYYLDPNTNAMLTGHRYIDGNWYYFDSSGAMVTNGMWYQDENGFRYQMGDGSFVYSGWIDEPTAGARYYLDANGYAVSGFQTIDGTLYYFFPDSHALLRDSWVTLDGNVYRAAPDGAILKDFQYIDGEYFYFDETTGKMQTGFVTFGNKWYYFSTEDGTMVTGWFTSPKTGYIYYFSEEGDMATGWAELDGDWYFFEDDMDKHYGQMLTGWVVSSTSGYTYYLGEDGKMLTGWQEIDGNTYYLHPTDETYLGRMVTGVNEIEGTNYVFDDKGVLIGQLAEPETEYFTVIYLNANGNYLGSEKVESGKSAVNIPETPAMEPDAQYTYTFTGWDTDLTSITADIVVTAVYDKAVNTYTVTFVGMDGSTIDTQTVEYGKSATAPKAPTVDGYTFTGWDTEFETVTENLTVKAEYERTEEIYYLRGEFNSWQTTDAMTKGENGIYTAVFTLDAGTYEYKAANADYSMEWPLGTNQSITLTEKSVVTFTLDTINHTLTASAESADVKYEVTFMDYDGTVLSTQDVKSGSSATAPETPVRDGYIFTGWSKEFDTITADTTIIAQYEKNEVVVNNFIVVFVDADGKFISSQLVAKGSSATAPEAPVKAGYTFTGWDKSFTNVTENLTVTALYSKNAASYTVTFYDYDGRVISTQTVSEGKSATAPENPTRAADVDYTYTFAGWDTEFDSVYEDISVNAVYNRADQVYYIRGVFNSWQTTDPMIKGMDGLYRLTLTLVAGTYEYKAANADYSMEWPMGTNQSITLDENSVVTFTLDTKNNTLTTSIESALVTYTVTFMDYDGTVLSTQGVKFGYAATAPQAPEREGYTFTGWSKDFTIISEDTVIIAQYEKVVVSEEKYIVAFVDGDGKLISTQLVAKGSSATAPEAPAKAGYTFTGWDKSFTNITEDITVKAQYKKVVTPVAPVTTGNFKVEIAGGNGFGLSLNSGAVRPQGTSYLNTKAPVGATATVTANTIEGLQFLGWYNPMNGACLSTDYVYTLTLTGDNFIKAMYQTVVSGVSTVIFKNDKASGGLGQIIEMQCYAAGDTITLPDGPVQVGYDFTGWNMTAAEISAAVARGEDVTVLATWERQIVKVNVTVKGGSGTGTYNANSGVTVVAYDAPAGQKFAYWTDETGKVRSYLESYKFYPSADTTLTAVFVDIDDAIDYQILVSMDAIDTVSAGTSNVFYYSWYVPEAELGINYVKAGILGINKDYYDESKFYVGSGLANMYDRGPSGTNNTPIKSWTWTKSNVPTGQTWIAKAYVQYTIDGVYEDDGVTLKLFTVYSDELEATKG